ncbi:transporter [Escherichia coli]|nr:transporter [Escherichia coli]MBW9854208.1 transporter [Escherichia coli]
MSVTDVVVPATVLLFPAALILTTAVLSCLPGVPLAGRAVVNGASEAVSALTGFHP